QKVQPILMDRIVIPASYKICGDFDLAIFLLEAVRFPVVVVSVVLNHFLEVWGVNDIVQGRDRSESSKYFVKIDHLGALPIGLKPGRMHSSAGESRNARRNHGG